MSEPVATTDESVEPTPVVPPPALDGAAEDAWVYLWDDPDLKRPVSRGTPNADFHSASLTPVSGELVVESSVAPPGDGDGGEVGLA